MLSDESMRASLQVAPLELTKPQPDVACDGSYNSNDSQISKPNTATNTVYVQSQMTPPATPNGSQEDLSQEPFVPPVFHNFLRAFYPFQPATSVTDASVTLPLDEGDVVLVHSVHTNGWADGTQLATGSRGWLPTNYCEAYEPEEMRSLLKSLLNFWDLLRSTSVDDSEIFQNQEFMKGIIGGVRYLLERTHCLTKESFLIQRSDGLRKCRKSLLSELSSLVKTAKRLQEIQRGSVQSIEDEVNDMVDQMILKAFKIVIKGVRFLDVMDDERRSRLPPVMSTVVEEAYIPPTPPADRAVFDEQGHETGGAVSTDQAASTSTELTTETRPRSQVRWSKRLSSLHSQPNANSYRLSQGSYTQANRLSATITHRVSLLPQHSQPDNLVSERLTKASDQFISHLASFIGRLRLRSARPEFKTAITLCVSSGGELLKIIDSICSQSGTVPEGLSKARATLKKRIETLVLAVRVVLVDAETDGADIIVPHDDILQKAAAACVKAAGDCVTKATTTMVKIGDFEIDPEKNTEPIDVSHPDILEDGAKTPVVVEIDDAVSVAESTHTAESISSSVRPASVVALDKPLPRVPDESPVAEELTEQIRSPDISRPTSAHDDNMSSTASSVSSIRPSLPPLPKLTTTLLPADHQSITDSYSHDLDFNPNFDIMTGSSAGSSATYLSRDSETSLMSQSSTRATTPDHSLAPRSQPSMSELSAAGSSTNTEEGDDVECRLLEKTYAYELVFNKEGQVTGGSLPALVERLTTHEATPDATFVSTFYLTFRLFCTPIKLAEALIDRFEYVGESPHMAAAVRLRVSNAFKGWLESHWRDQTDREALKLIVPFAENQLGAILPSASGRLLELAHKVSGDGALVPRFVSSMGRTNTTLNQLVPADLPLPSPVLSKSQLNLLNAFKAGAATPTIMDFDPLELARQLTVKQMSIFCSILPEELLSSQWMKKGGVDAPNVKAMSSLSTDLSNLVAETILQHTEIKKRAAVIKQWIKIAHQCLELNNYDGVMAIICSLNSSTISRLRKTWDTISLKRKETLQNLQEIVEPSQNNKVLRTRLQDHVPPCLPFLGMYLTDLTFVDIGNPATKQLSLGSDADEDGAGGLTVVNFDKHTRTAKIIGELQRFQIPYRLTEVPEMQDWMSAQIQRIHEGDQGNVQVSYYRKSLLLEPREAVPRRDVEPATPMTTSAPTSRGDLFGWMSRGGQASGASQL
ncbi:Ras guanine nucleotide exchange factor A [Cladobotryum mycophilum]|uniref:Ras guanine nucleotide exchange factor A n=1 Tax=Cladobotryum mycophilum TaxID=491253 RepID=A0ABR0T022_9HYPO